MPLSTITPASPISHQQNLQPPYLSQTAILGEVPSRSVDVPITAVFLVLFVIGAISNMTLFRRNKARGHFFLPSFFLYVFCMARILSCSLRIAWAYYPNNASLSIAAFIFVSAGVLIIFVVNLIFAQRIVRAMQPAIGWSPAFGRFYKLLYALTVFLLVITVVAIVHSHYTLDTARLHADSGIELGAITYFLSLAFLPIFLVYISHVLPRTRKPVKFGAGSWRAKVRILTVGASLCIFGAGFRAGSQFMHPRRPDDPAWYHSKVCFYLFNFTVEVLVVYLYLVTRVDQRFYIPNGSRDDGDYARKPRSEDSSTDESENRKSSFSSYARIFDGSSSIYSWGNEDEKYPEEEEPSSPGWSCLSDEKWGSDSKLQLPPEIVQSRMRVVSMEEAPYVDITFSHEQHQYGDDDWFLLPPPAALRSFGL